MVGRLGNAYGAPSGRKNQLADEPDADRLTTEEYEDIAFKSLQDRNAKRKAASKAEKGTESDLKKPTTEPVPPRQASAAEIVLQKKPAAADDDILADETVQKKPAAAKDAILADEISVAKKPSVEIAPKAKAVAPKTKRTAEAAATPALQEEVEWDPTYSSNRHAWVCKFYRKGQAAAKLAGHDKKMECGQALREKACKAWGDNH